MCLAITVVFKALSPDFMIRPEIIPHELSDLPSCFLAYARALMRVFLIA